MIKISFFSTIAYWMQKNGNRRLFSSWLKKPSNEYRVILAPVIQNGAFDESTGSYPVFGGFDSRSLPQANSMPDLSRSTPVREVTFVCFDFTELDCLETEHDPKSGKDDAPAKFFDHIHTQSLALETLISAVRSV